MGGVVDDEELFKLSKIAKKFGRFFGRHKFLGAGIVKVVPILSLLPRGMSPVPLRVCASKPWLISSVCKNSRALHPLRAEI